MAVIPVRTLTDMYFHVLTAPKRRIEIVQLIIRFARTAQIKKILRLWQDDDRLWRCGCGNHRRMDGRRIVAE